jgi:hypothetical protein
MIKALEMKTHRHRSLVEGRLFLENLDRSGEGFYDGDGCGLVGLTLRCRVLTAPKAGDTFIHFEMNP